MSGFAKWRVLVLFLCISHIESLYAMTCEYIIHSEWNSGFTAAIRVTNSTDVVVDGWSVEWSFSDGATVAHIWNASLESGTVYRATNLDWNRFIQPQSTVEFGFNGQKGSMNAPAQIPQLGGVCSSDIPTNQAPIADAQASALSGSVPLSVTFNASGSSDPDGDPLSYLWDFGDGTTSNDMIVTRTFNQVGSFPVSLVVNDGTISSTPASLIITTEDLPNDVTYTLDGSRSSLHFVSTKNVNTVEAHSFSGLTGRILNTGEAELTIDLNSVDTGIDIRNERIRNLLFDTATFSEASVTLLVDLSMLDTIPVGDIATQDVTATLDLHGVRAALDTRVSITRISASQILVQNSLPIIIKAGDYSLVDGIDALRDIANLAVISYAVPVNFSLFFTTP